MFCDIISAVIKMKLYKREKYLKKIRGFYTIVDSGWGSSFGGKYQKTP